MLNVVALTGQGEAGNLIDRHLSSVDTVAGHTFLTLAEGGWAAEVLAAMVQSLAHIESPDGALERMFDHAFTAVATGAPGDTWRNPSSALVAQVGGEEVTLGWVGAAQAVLCRGSEVVAATQAHVHTVSSANVVVPHARRMPTRNLSGDSRLPPETCKWQVRQGDLVVLVSGSVAAAMTPQQMLDTASIGALPRVASELLWKGFETGDSSGAAVIAVEVIRSA